MKMCKNGVIREMTEAEITNVAILAQEEALKPTSQELTRDEKVDLILAAIPTNAPEGTTGTDLPFKLGYKWKPAYNGNAFAWELVPDPDAIGTADNPIIWVAGVRLIPNAYYLYQNVRYVYMGAEEGYAGDAWDGTDMEEF